MPHVLEGGGRCFRDLLRLSGPVGREGPGVFQLRLDCSHNGPEIVGASVERIHCLVEKSPVKSPEDAYGVTMTTDKSL